MNSTIVQIGVGGIFVLLLLQVLLPFVIKVINKGNGKQQSIKAGEMDTAWWQKEIGDITEAAMQRGMIQLLKPSLDAQTDVLREIRTDIRSMREGITQLVKALESWERKGR